MRSNPPMILTDANVLAYTPQKFEPTRGRGFVRQALKELRRAEEDLHWARVLAEQKEISKSIERRLLNFFRMLSKNRPWEYSLV
jgi:hypothetical protein